MFIYFIFSLTETRVSFYQDHEVSLLIINRSKGDGLV